MTLSITADRYQLFVKTIAEPTSPTVIYAENVIPFFGRAEV